MIRTKEGFQCPKCGKVLRVKTAKQLEKRESANQSDYVYVSEDKDDSSRIARACPKCGNPEALYWFSGVSGEHAGVARERTVEHFKCTRCSHSWTESS